MSGIDFPGCNHPPNKPSDGFSSYVKVEIQSERGIISHLSGTFLQHRRLVTWLTEPKVLSDSRLQPFNKTSRSPSQPASQKVTNYSRWRLRASYRATCGHRHDNMNVFPRLGRSFLWRKTFITWRLFGVCMPNDPVVLFVVLHWQKKQKKTCVLWCQQNAAVLTKTWKT